MRWLIVLMYFAGFSTGWASDASQLEIIGFSKNGNYFAYEQFGALEGSGENYADLTILETTKNDFAAKPFQQNSIEKSLDSIRELNKTKATPKLKELALIKPERGNHLLSRPLTDLSGSPYQVEFALQPTLAGASSDVYLLKLETKETNQDCFGLGKGKIFTLTLQSKTDNQIQTLQKDTQLPSSRGCPLDYRIADIYAYQDKIVVFLNMFFIGTEGRNMRYLSVSGHIKDSYKKKSP